MILQNIFFPPVDGLTFEYTYRKLYIEYIIFMHHTRSQGVSPSLGFKKTGMKKMSVTKTRSNVYLASPLATSFSKDDDPIQ